MRSGSNSTGAIVGRWAAIALAMSLIALTLAAQAPAPNTAQNPTQKVFATPEEAVLALAGAASANNTDELMAIFGPDAARLLSSGDPVADRRAREVFTAAFAENTWLEPESANRRTLYLGHEEWPFPIPLIRKAGKWRFDTAAGAEEVWYRRIGRNELSTIRACLAYVAAQKEYASKGRDGKPAGLYAQKFFSEPGKHDGLYWKMHPMEEPSPLGELVAEAAGEGYTRSQGKPTPFHGYYFRILTAQGKGAPGGAKSYVANGEMRGGFALLAYPAEYENSGVVTFIVNQNGVVYEKDLGEQTAKLASEMTEYNTDRMWMRSND